MENSEDNLVNLDRRDFKYKQLIKEQRQGVIKKLLQQMKENKLKHGTINKVATAFRVSRITVSRIWHAAQTQYRECKICADVSLKKKERCGRKAKNYSNNLAQIKNTPLNRRGTLRSPFLAIAIPKSTLFDIFKSGKYIERRIFYS